MILTLHHHNPSGRMASTLLASICRPQLLARLANGQRSYASLGLKPTFLSLRVPQQPGCAPATALALSRQRVNGPLKWGGISYVGPGQHRRLSASRPSLRHYVPPSYGQKPKLLGFLNRIPENALFAGILVVNSVVFLMWYLAIAKYVSESYALVSDRILILVLHNYLAPRNKMEMRPRQYGCNRILQPVGTISPQDECMQSLVSFPSTY